MPDGKTFYSIPKDIPKTLDFQEQISLEVIRGIRPYGFTNIPLRQKGLPVKQEPTNAELMELLEGVVQLIKRQFSYDELRELVKHSKIPMSVS